MLVASLAGYAVLAALFSLTIPLWEAPDSIWHHQFVVHLAQGGDLPDRADAGLTAPWRQEGGQPPLYYLATALLVAPIDTSDAPELIRENPHAAVGLAAAGGNLNRMVHTRRERFPWHGTALAAHLVGLAGILFGLVAIAATWSFAREAFPDRPIVAAAAAGILAFNPQVIFLSGAITNDVAAAAGGALCFWRMAVVLRRGGSAAGWFWLGLALGLASLAKLSALWLVPLAVGVVAVSAWDVPTEGAPAAGDDVARTRHGPSIGRLLVALAWLAVPWLLVAGPWYLRNWRLFGDPTGLPLMHSLYPPRELPPSPRELAGELVAVWKSLWAVFGWFNVIAPAWVYGLLTLLVLIGLGRLAWLVGRHRFRPAETKALLLAGCGVLLVGAGILAWARVNYPQGRLFFAALPALALLVATGWTAARPPRQAAGIAWAINGGLALLSLWLLPATILPAYRPEPGHPTGAAATPLAELGDLALQAATVTARPAAGSPRRSAETDSGVAVGEEMGVVAGDERPVLAEPGGLLEVALEWAVRRPPGGDYSVFLHLLDENDLIVAQRDSYPQAGAAPTSDWAAGMTYPDRHVWAIPPVAPAPGDCRLVLGVYNHATGERLKTAGGANEVSLARVRLTPAMTSPGIPNPVGARFGDDIELAGFRLERRAARPGETIPLSLYWRALRPPRRDYKVSVQLRRGAAETWAQHDEEPADGRAPTSTWKRGAVIEDLHPMTISDQAPADAYHVYVTLYDPETGRPLPVDYRHPELTLGPFRVQP